MYVCNYTICSPRRDLINKTTETNFKVFVNALENSIYSIYYNKNVY